MRTATAVATALGLLLSAPAAEAATTLGADGSGAVRLTGDDADARISASYGPDDGGALVVSFFISGPVTYGANCFQAPNGQPTCRNATSLTIDAGGGDDLLDLRVQAPGSGQSVPTTVIGGTGIDRIDARAVDTAPVPVGYTIMGGDESDLIHTGSGNDRVFGEGGSDEIRSGAGDDEIDGGGDQDNVEAGAGNDVVRMRDNLAEAGPDCGDGVDTAIVDGGDSVNANCETVERGTVAGDRVDPRIRAMTIRPRSFPARNSGGSIGSAGARVSYRISEAATVRFTVERRIRRRGRGVWDRMPGSFSHVGVRGDNSFLFTGRLRGARLPGGSYRLVATPTDTARNRGTPVRRPFTIR